MILPDQQQCLTKGENQKARHVDEHGNLQLGNQRPQQTRAKKPKAPESVTPVHHSATNLEFGPIRLDIYRHLDNTDPKTGDEQLAEKGKQPQRQ